MYCLFHKWSKWSELKKEKWWHRDLESGREISYERNSQERICEKCNKVAKRYLDD